MHLYWFFGAVFFCFGLIFGSFLNVCIYRLPRGLSVVSPRSACPQCHTPIAAYDNIPVLSWLLLGGRCRHCHMRITPRYAMVELLCGVLFLLCFLQDGVSSGALTGCVFCFLTLGLAFTDAETHLLPDVMTLTGLALALALSFVTLVPGPAFHFFPIHYHSGATLTGLNVQLGLRSLGNALLGAAVGAGILWAIAWTYLKLRKIEGMGMGDVKLMAMVGAFLGAPRTIFVMCLASLLGGLYGGLVLLAIFRKRLVRYRAHKAANPAARAWKAANGAMRYLEIPFGVFLCTVAILCWFYGNQMIRAYLGMYLLAV